MALHASQGFNARPLEFRYAAEFQPQPKRGESIVLAGQRTLRLDGINTSRHPLTGYGELNARSIQLRERPPLEPLVSETDVRDLLMLLTSVANLMGQAVQDKRYPKPIDEAMFQIDLQAICVPTPPLAASLRFKARLRAARSTSAFEGSRSSSNQSS